jgi:hypothetical protein
MKTDGADKVEGKLYFHWLQRQIYKTIFLIKIFVPFIFSKMFEKYC